MSPENFFKHISSYRSNRDILAGEDIYKILYNGPSSEFKIHLCDKIGKDKIVILGGEHPFQGVTRTLEDFKNFEILMRDFESPDDLQFVFNGADETGMQLLFRGPDGKPDYFNL